MYDYETVEINGAELLHRSDGAWIPFDKSNRDYVEYLALLEPELPEVKETPETPEAE
jgi:hypothetical protein